MMTYRKLKSIREDDENPFMLFGNDMMTYRKLKSTLEDDENMYILFSNDMMTYRETEVDPRGRWGLICLI